MPGTFSDSWKLTKTSFRLIREDRALLVFPVVAGLSILGVLVLFLLGALWLFPLVLAGGAATTHYEVLGALLFVALYFAISFISVYTTAALVGAATLKLNGQQPTAADGWRIARSKFVRLLAWSLITATVGLAIQVISSRVRGVGGILIGAVGGATWGVVTYFMIPVLVYEDLGAWKSLSRSARLYISNFGRSIVTNLVLGLLIGAGIVVAVVLGTVGLLVLVGGSVIVGLVLIVVAIAVAAAVLLIGATAEGVLQAALYRYATTGKIDPDMLPAPLRSGGVRADPTVLP
ncbi:MAG TPA: DUF6159 family protein [Thermoplasmata archaeon]|nr:DUF6159 family protein [Thermoplasmata archaeon]